MEETMAKTSIGIVHDLLWSFSVVSVRINLSRTDSALGFFCAEPLKDSCILYFV